MNLPDDTNLKTSLPAVFRHRPVHRKLDIEFTIWIINYNLLRKFYQFLNAYITKKFKNNYLSIYKYLADDKSFLVSFV